ncbi:MAG: cell division protein FtsK [Bdellovibrionales bacterium CG10_big_fil_rev_8_21_14_0_10_45_34]|nr:MAG: cell division protein FtsK [Bdellovibrionales bacterium CG10_big_fil_rev_8_21_14_0_10_45_34]
MTNPKRNFKSDVIVLSLLSASVFLVASLLTYHPQDPSWNSVGDSVRNVRNACGWVGALVADGLYLLFGGVAWFASAILIVPVVKRLGIGRQSSANLHPVLSLITLIFLASLASLHFKEFSFFEGHVLSGGIIGVFLATHLKGPLNEVGSALFLWTGFLLSLLSLTQLDLRNFSVFIIDRTAFTMKTIWYLLTNLFGKAKSTIVRRATMKKEKGIDFSPQPVESDQRANAVSLSGAKKVVDWLLKDSPQEDEIPRSEELSSTIRSRLFAKEQNPVKTKKKISLKAIIKVENWMLPKLDLLEEPKTLKSGVDKKSIEKNIRLLEDKLSQFSVNGKVTSVRTGPAVTLFEFKPNVNVKLSRITDLADDLSLALSSESLRIIAPLPGRDVVGIETSNADRETVFLRDLIESTDFWSDEVKLPLALGKKVDGETQLADLRKMPHLMVAGTTGSGKSVFVIATLTSLLFRHSPKTLKLVLVDPKQVDLASFYKVPHLALPPVQDAKKAVLALKWAVREMEKRYRSMSRFEVRGIDGFNEMAAQFTAEDLEVYTKENEQLIEAGKPNKTFYFEPLPFMVIVVEEFGDLMAVDKGNVEGLVVRLAQMARACGIHLILAMQSPRKDVVTGLIKTNIPGRISFKVASKMDSRIILDESGAERLLAKGDMLFLAPGMSKPERHHAPWVSEQEVSSVCKFWSDQSEPVYDPDAVKWLDQAEKGGEPSFSNSGDEFADENAFDERYDEILAFVATQKDISASLLQRRFKLGYPRAARMIEIFEKEGVVGPSNGSKPRSVLIQKI